MLSTKNSVRCSCVSYKGNCNGTAVLIFQNSKTSEPRGKVALGPQRPPEEDLHFHGVKALDGYAGHSNHSIHLTTGEAPSLECESCCLIRQGRAMLLRSF